MAKLTDDDILAFTKLLQEPVITAACTENCGCNEVCGCKKEACCEAKCKCDGKTQSDTLVRRPEDLVLDPKYAELLKNFDASKIKTIKDFQGIVQGLQSDLSK